MTLTSIIHTNSSGQLHRIDGPAIDFGDNPNSRWYINNVRITSWDQLKYEAELTDEEVLQLALIYGKISS